MIEPATPPTARADGRAGTSPERQRPADRSAQKDRVLRMIRRLNSDLNGQLEGHTQQLAALNQLVAKINATLNLRDVAATAMDGLQRLVGLQAASLALVTAGGDIVFVMGHPREILPVLSRFKLKVGQGIVGRVIESGRAHLANDAGRDPDFFSGVDRATGFQTRSVLCEPLVVRERVIGAVQLINKWAGPFTQADRDFVETVAGSLAIAVKNARMMDRIREQVRVLEAKNDALIAAQDQLIQSGKLAAIGELSAGLAHEINNPMGIILGLSHLIRQRTTDEKTAEFAASIERETMRVKRILIDLLGFARTTTPQATLGDLRHTIERALNLIEYQLPPENIVLHRMLPTHPIWVDVDHEQIVQVLMNLIQNSRQAMPGGGKLAALAWTDGDSALFSISDTGVGIPEENLSRIFDPFFTTKPVGQGTGLGLSVSYGIVARHGGEMRVTSRPGVGSAFVVRLPLAPAPEERPE